MGKEHLVFPASPATIRSVIDRLFAPSSGLLAGDTAMRDSARIVLAEVLNNIVEHSYGGKGGEIDLRLELSERGLAVQVSDRGRPMPGGTLPVGLAPRLSDVATLPEGGFGWFMIRQLVRDLEYQRIGPCNRLSFCIPSEQIVKELPHCR